MRGDSKIRAAHLERVALVYVRQTTLVLVRDYTESTASHYALVEEATRLGWARPPGRGARIAVVDADLGVSGASTEGRTGFPQARGAGVLRRGRRGLRPGGSHAPFDRSTAMNDATEPFRRPKTTQPPQSIAGDGVVPCSWRPLNKRSNAPGERRCHP